MYTSLGILALAGSLVAPTPTPAPDLVWWRDYHAALQKGAKEQKPLAVFVGAGQGGYYKLTQEGQLNDSIRSYLTESYVCVYLDVTNKSQEDLIKALAVTKGNGLVISDRTGGLQAFYHDGQLSEAALAGHLKHFAEPNLNISTTVTNQRISYYPTGSSSNPRKATPAFSTRSC
jgi:hypothetical protein